MNTLKEMGIQQWRLKPSFRAKVSSTQVLLGDDLTDMEVEPAFEEAIVDSVIEVDSTAADLNPAPETATDMAVTADLQSEPYTVKGADVPLNDSIAEVEPTVSDLGDIDWHGLQAMIDNSDHCPSCGLGNTLLGAGDPNADWMFVIDAPSSRDIEAQALFAGRAGQLFEAMLNAIGLDRDRVYTTSVFKCAPIDDLSVTPQCDALVHRQIQLVDPKIVVAFGEFAAQAVIKSNTPLDALRDTEQRCFRTQKTIIASYSPEQMLDDVSLKPKVWNDLKACLKIVEA